MLVRQPSTYGFGRASYELNLGCNYDCEHCYLGLKRFEGLNWPERERLLHIMRDAGVLWLQLAGGEPTIDRLFPEFYTLAWNLGMMITISSNGSRLHGPCILEMLTTRRPYRLTLSVYGATETSYDGLTRRRGAFKAFTKGLSAAHKAGLPINLNLVVTRHNERELDQMRALAENYGVSTRYSRTSRRQSTAAPKPCHPSPSSSYASASHSPAAAPVTRISTSIRTVEQASARSAVTPTSH